MHRSGEGYRGRGNNQYKGLDVRVAKTYKIRLVGWSRCRRMGGVENEFGEYGDSRSFLKDHCGVEKWMGK